ncbi:ABC transporter permease subunit [Geobacillus sp. YF-1]|uniref:ABC transporter permease subunit n=1 Tax=Geobacillus sp. YF-1 TaxID=3457480 RepID=UPI0040465EE9
MNEQLRKSIITKIISLITIIFTLILWMVSTKLKWIDPVFLPSPQSLWKTFLDLCHNGYKDSSLGLHIMQSMYRLLVALLLAFVTAVPLGIVCGMNSYILAIFEPFIEFYRPLPPLAYYTLLVLWLGIDNSSKIALLYLSAFAPLFLATLSSVKQVPKDRIHAALSLGAKRMNVLFSIIFPSCLPDIITGLRTATGVAYSTLVAAEMVAATSGIGWMVLDASKYLRSDVVFVGIFIMGGIAILLDGVIRLYQRKQFTWVGKE